MSETKFHNYTEPQAKLMPSIFWFVHFSAADEKTEGNGLNCNKYYQNSGNWSGQLGLLLKSYKLILIPFNIPPPQSIHTCIWIFHTSKPCCRSSADTLYSRSTIFYFTLLTDMLFALGTGNSYREFNPVNVEGGGGAVWGLKYIFQIKYCFTAIALWATLLSWCKIHDFFHDSGLFFLTCSRSLARASQLMLLINHLTCRYQLSWLCLWYRRKRSSLPSIVTCSFLHFSFCVKWVSSNISIASSLLLELFPISDGYTAWFSS
jgi:hypothetical protein